MFAFECSRSELRQLFGAFGAIKSVRMPKKFDHSNRGFAFVEFGSHGDAEKAMSGLKHTHLYGRHLVIEWSEDDSSGGLGSLRQRAAKRYAELSAGISTENKKARTS